MMGIWLIGLHDLAQKWADNMTRACWEGGLFILGVWLACRLLRRLPAALRCSLWWLACLKLVIGFIWTSPVALSLLPAPPPVMTSPARPSSAALDRPLQMPPGAAGPIAPSVNTATANHRPVRATVHLVPSPASPTTASRHFVTLPMVCSGIWLTLLLLRAVLLLRQWNAARRLCRQTSILQAPQIEAFAAEIARRMGLRHMPRLLVSDRLESPIVIGLCHPVIVLPRRDLGRLTPRQWEMALAHELAHLRRGDLWLSLLPAVAHWLFWFHPLVWLARHEFAICREAACDAEAIQVTAQPSDIYGQLLLQYVRARTDVAIMGGLGALSNFRTLQRRLAMLAQATLQPQNRRRVELITLLTVAVIGLIPLRVVSAAQSISDTSLADNPRLQQRVSVRAEGIPLGELLPLLSARTGVSLQADVYTADDKVVAFCSARPLQEIMTDLAALFNDTWIHVDQNGRHAYRLTRLGRARDYEERRAGAMNQGFLAQLDEQIKALNETPAQLARRPENDPIRQALAQEEGRVATSIMALLSPAQRQQLVEQWSVSLPVAAMNEAQKDGIEGLFHGDRLDEINRDPALGGAQVPEISREQMDQHAVTFRVLSASGANRQSTEMSVTLSAPSGLDMPVTRFRTSARFLLPAHGNPYTGAKLATGVALPILFPSGGLTLTPGAWVDRLRAISEQTGSPVFADYYRSPSAVVPEQNDEATSENPTVAALDAACKREGYLWWNRGKTLLLRKRDWYNQQLYEVPDRWVLALSSRLQRQHGVPTYADVLSLLDLSTNQIAGLNESLGQFSNRRLLYGLRELLLTVAAISSNKTAPIFTGVLNSPTENNLRRATVMGDLNDARQRAMLHDFAQVFDAKLFSNPAPDEFGFTICGRAIRPGQETSTAPARVDVFIYRDFKGQQTLRAGFMLALPTALPDDRRDKISIKTGL